MQKIVPSLWSDHDASHMAELYGKAFGATITQEVRYPENPLEFQKDLAGEILTLDLNFQGYRINIINADGTFRPTPSMSFRVNFNSATDDNAQESLREAYRVLVDDGAQVLMELDSYPFSDLYAWVEDRFGVSWQLMLAQPENEPRPFIMPALMFTRGHHTQEFTQMLLRLFPGSTAGTSVLVPGQDQQVMFSEARIAGDWMMISDGGDVHDFTFTCGNSLIVSAKDQEELDRLWSELSAVPEAEQCGWCQDKFGVSWQIIPGNLEELMQKPDAYSKLMQMKKIEIDQF